MTPRASDETPIADAAPAGALLRGLGSLEEFETPELRAWLADWLATHWQPLFGQSLARLDGRALAKALHAIRAGISALRRFAANLTTDEQLRAISALGARLGLSITREKLLTELRLFFDEFARLRVRPGSNQFPDEHARQKANRHWQQHEKAFRASRWFNAGAVRKHLAKQAAMDLPQRFYPRPRKRKLKNGNPTEVEVRQANLRFAFGEVCSAFVFEDVQDGPLAMPTAVQDKISSGAGITRKDLLALLVADAEARENRTPPTPQQALRRAAQTFLEPDRHQPERLARFVVQATAFIHEKSARMPRETRQGFVRRFLQIGETRGRVVRERRTDTAPQLDKLLLSLLRLPTVREALLLLERRGSRQKLRRALTVLFLHLRNSLIASVADTTEDVFVLGTPHLRSLESTYAHTAATLVRDKVEKQVCKFRESRGLSVPSTQGDVTKGQSFDVIFRRAKRKHRSWYSAS